MLVHQQNLGKVINNFECYLVAILSSDAAINSKVGDDVVITLSSGKEITAKIKYKTNEANNKVLIIFDLRTLTEELIEYRKISFNITWWSYSGLKVPNTAIAEDENGLKYVIKKKTTGNEKIIVKVLKKNDKFSVVTQYKQEELNSLKTDMQKYTKISEYDTILLYISN